MDGFDWLDVKIYTDIAEMLDRANDIICARYACDHYSALEHILWTGVKSVLESEVCIND